MEPQHDYQIVGDFDRWPGAPVVILNSRQGKRPCRADGWVEATMRAIEAQVAADRVLITSVGLNTWELALHVANSSGGRQLVILPPPTEPLERIIGRLLSDFQLDRNRVSFLFLPAAQSGSRRGEKWWWSSRDAKAIELAERIVPISLRKGSKLTALLAEAESRSQLVVESFKVDYQAGVDQVGYRFGEEQLNPLFKKGWPYLTHWTRSSHTPFPGESSYEYYHDLICSDRYPRAAIDVLGRIISERCLRASGRFLRAEQEAVAFTSQNPTAAVKLMRWRRRYVYYSFEPYGIAIAKSIAQDLGIRPVIYGPPELYESLPEADRPYFQNQGAKAADWLPEYEMRHLGDLELNQLPTESVKLIVQKEEEIELLPKGAPYQIIPLLV
jgi:hypothetical protein